MATTKQKKLLKILFFSIVVLLLFSYVYDHREAFEIFRHISKGFLLLIGLTITLLILANSLFLKVLLIAFDREIPLHDSMEITSLSSLLNIITPFRGGTGVKAVYLKRTQNLNYKDFVTLLLGNYVIIFLVNSFFGIVGIIFYLLSGNYGSFYVYSLLGVFIGLFLVMLFLIFVDVSFMTNLIGKYSDHEFLQKVNKLIIRVNSGWRSIIGNRTVLYSIIVLTFVNYILFGLSYFLELRSVGLNASILNSMIYSSLSSITTLIGITPGAIGVKEGILLFSQELLGISAPQLVAISLYDRLLNLIVVSVFYLSIILGSRIIGRPKAVELEEPLINIKN